jgi:hypothetical protein
LQCFLNQFRKAITMLSDCVGTYTAFCQFSTPAAAKLRSWNEVRSAVLQLRRVDQDNWIRISKKKR